MRKSDRRADSRNVRRKQKAAAKVRRNSSLNPLFIEHADSTTLLITLQNTKPVCFIE
jgi:hypothetical protein